MILLLALEVPTPGRARMRPSKTFQGRPPYTCLFPHEKTIPSRLHRLL